MTRIRLPGATNKYSAKKTEYNGRVYASRAEARRAQELQLLENAGEIRGLEYQPRYPITVNDVKVCTYIADFRYYEGPFLHRHLVVEDVKGHRTREYMTKKRLMLAVYGIEIREVGAND